MLVIIMVIVVMKIYFIIVSSIFFIFISIIWVFKYNIERIVYSVFRGMC